MKRELMHNRKIAGVVTAVVGLVAIMVFFNAGMDTSLLSLPLETYLGVAFTLVFMTGMPVWLACIIGAVMFILIAIGFYNLGSWLYGLVVGRG